MKRTEAGTAAIETDQVNCAWVIDDFIDAGRSGGAKDAPPSLDAYANNGVPTMKVS